ncbi:lipopolysaccharide transport system ATP-binding protein [Flavobacterium sp. PL11]|jgi:lipopolysaccharide transport system ATP-binding protein|uniref:ABC transporter ATP-binding protein n=1 Tax=Flavobacterium sp. PL11 TaxID=3071717 RepID=UPI002DF8C92C|nr:lipopolysaccharide transport system ATP-binding protein [Flavobacterium sp. PL11]
MTKDIILIFENISKQYRLGQVGTGTLGHDLNRWWYNIRGKENPYLKIGEISNRKSTRSNEYVWSLQNITFEVARGEVLGIIGKNGAGKSTLLKILSKITAPTTGIIKSKGRIASLLEVGTGFHGELTGRENIYLNGAILGMTKNEITLKLDEIIEFSGCERYIDTPVKRYSSGMVVRLAFAVAAFLEPEILVIDEVLAVGDAEFQKKAIGKIQDISKSGGRTVLFVSHNMAAIRNLCTSAIVLDQGKLVFKGSVQDSIDFYSALNLQLSKEESQHIDISKTILINDCYSKLDNKIFDSGQYLKIGDQLSFVFDISFLDHIFDFSIILEINNLNGELISHITNEDDGLFFKVIKKEKRLVLTVETGALLYVPGFYSINVYFNYGSVQTLYKIINFLNFHLEQGSYSKRTQLIPINSKVYLPTKWINNLK